MKKTLKDLQQELDDMRSDRDRYYEKWQKLEDEKQKKQSFEVMSLQSERSELQNQVRALMEIIRWHINPETTKYPFDKELKEKTEQELREGRRFN